MKFIRKLFDAIIPRFVQEDVALIDTGEGLRIVCSMHDVEPDEEFDAVCTVQSFNLFGIGMFPKLVGKPRPWPADR